MAAWDPKAFEDSVIADMRAHDGAVTSGPLAGHPLLVMDSIGAKSGQPRRALLTFSRDGDAYVVAGTAGGAKTPPNWLANIQAHPEVDVEAENRTFKARASVAEGADRDRLWERHVERLPWFVDYPEQSGRVIPMIRLQPTEDA